MTNKEIVLSAHRNMGRADALALREKAVAGTVTNTEIIENEIAVPAWDGKKDYSKAEVGSAVSDGGQVYGLIQPHNAANYPNTTPAVLSALWRVKHTTDPKKAKPWVQPTSTSDMYLKGECMVWTDGLTYQCVAENGTVYSPVEYLADWKVVA